ncbi:porin [Psychrobium sp. 1_MG-2023]|uniref:porin n=1 Tax=Psychrobium sp. 1_MG-2023 TaxID=3062624 RepID=UPI000C33B376|nr:porin [Psychrobium sp. 1_MG-2023]MDP2560921.1 porin [Psychrobium sp. 1_MG-2023]PKF55995.1 porin [Alteromonadales bacterium alter-6D02]
MKKFNKTLLALSAALIFNNTAFAGDLVEVYGKVNVSAQNDDAEESTSNVNSNASRIGLRGHTKIDDSLRAIYKLEWQVDVADDEGDLFKARSQWIGLEGDFGTVMLGRNETALKDSQGKIDQFNDLSGDQKVFFNGDNRVGDSIYYTTPSFNGFKLATTLVAEDNKKSDGKAGSSIAIVYGDKKLKKTALYAAVAMDSDIAGRDATRVAVQGKLGDVKLGAIWNDTEKSDGSDSGDGFLVSAAYKMGKTTLKAQFQDSDDKKSGDSMSFGADYKLAKNIKVFGFFTAHSFDDGSESDHLGLGMEYKF